MKTPYRDITEVLRLNRWMVLAVVGLCLMVSSFAIWTVYSLNKKMLNSAFAISHEGEVLPLKLVERRENLEVEAKAHLERFHRLFYGLDPGNHTSQLEKALWLGDSSVDQVYRQKKNDGLYNRLLQFSLRQEVLQVEIEVDLAKKPYVFKVITEFEVYRGSSSDRYQLISSGKLIEVARNFPHNPHGLLITEYFENSLQKRTPQSP